MNKYSEEYENLMFKRRWGSIYPPDHDAICKICGNRYGDHYGFECPDARCIEVNGGEK